MPRGRPPGSTSPRPSSWDCSTTKPFIYVFNLDEDQLADAELQASLRELAAPADAVFLNAKLEMDLMEMEPDEALELLQSFGAEESGLDQLARTGFHTLGLQTYLTAGPKESRAWTIGKGWTAPMAAGVIHTDFQRGFIKAEIVCFEDLVAAGNDERRQGGRQGPHRGQGLRHGRRRRRGVPLQRVEPQAEPVEWEQGRSYRPLTSGESTECRPADGG